MMIKQIKKTLRLPGIMFSAISGFIFLLTQSTSTSPLYLWSYVDSTIFRLMGLTLVRGGKFYVTTIDSKGPVLFFIEALGAWISSGKIGIFIIQYIFLLVTLISVLLIAKQLVANKYIWIFPLLYLCFYGFAFEGGNLSEEFSLSFIFLGIYLVLYLFKNGSLGSIKTKISFKTENLLLFSLGSLAALTFFIRANNAAAIIAAILALTYFMLKRLPAKQFFTFFSSIIAGFLLVTSILAGYFIINHSYSDMIYGTFLFNYRYSINHSRDFSNTFLTSFSAAAIVVCILSLTTAFLYYHSKRDAKVPLLLVLVGVFSTLTLYISGHNWLHYLQLLMPPFIISLMMLCVALDDTLKQVSERKIYSRLGHIGLFIFLLMDFSVVYGYRHERKANEINIRDSIQIINEIPVNQRNSVYGYGINPLPFTETSVLPSKRLTALQDWMIQQDPFLKNEVYSYFQINPPKWLILSPQYPPEDAFISKFVSSNYRQVYSNTNYTLYELTISE